MKDRSPVKHWSTSSIIYIYIYEGSENSLRESDHIKQKEGRAMERALGNASIDRIVLLYILVRGKRVVKGRKQRKSIWNVRENNASLTIVSSFYYKSITDHGCGK